MTVVLGVLGLFVARSTAFAGRTVALLGSDAGFRVDGKINRRWELKFIWFNPLWAILTLLAGVLILLAVRRVQLAWAAAAMLAEIGRAHV